MIKDKLTTEFVQRRLDLEPTITCWKTLSLGRKEDTREFFAFTPLPTNPLATTAARQYVSTDPTVFDTLLKKATPECAAIKTNKSSMNSKNLL